MRDMIRIGQTGEAIETAEKKRPLIREIYLIDEEEYRDDDNLRRELSGLQKMLAPGLWRGWAEGTSDSQNRVCYQLTDTGLAILDEGHDAQRTRLIEIEKPDASEAAADRYWQTYYAEIEARKGWDDEAARANSVLSRCRAACRPGRSLCNSMRTKPNASDSTCIVPSAEAA